MRMGNSSLFSGAWLFGSSVVLSAMAFGCSGSSDASSALGKTSTALETASNTQNHDLCDFAVYSTGQSQIRDRARVKGGLVGTSGQRVELSADSMVLGSVESTKDVDLRSRAYVDGDVRAGGNVSQQTDVTVTGIIQDHTTVIPVVVPARSFQCTSTAWTVVENGKTSELAAGSYGNVVVRAGGKLILHAGAYTFNSLRFESGGNAQHAILDVDAPEGLDVQVCGELYFGNFLDMNLLGDTSSRSLSFYSKTAGMVTVGTDTTFYGTITAPGADVHAYSRNVVEGSLYGRDVWIEPDSEVRGSGCCPAAHDWSRFHRDNSARGYTPSYAPMTSDILWKFPTNSNVLASPAVVGDKVFFGAMSGSFYAVNRYTGEQIWTRQLPGWPYSSPAVAEGKVFVLYHPGTIYALNADDGSVAWTVQFPSGAWDWSSPAVDGKQVFFAASYGYVYSLDISTGAVNWSAFVGGQPNSAITVHAGRVYTGTHNFNNSSPTLVALDEYTGKQIWEYNYFKTHNGVTGMMAVNGATVVDLPNGRTELCLAVYNWGGVSNQLVCVDERDGTELWSQSLEGNSTSTPAVHKGVLFVGSDAAKVFAVNATDGSILWWQGAAAAVWAAPAVSSNGEVCYGALDHTIYCVNETDGKIVWSLNTGSSRVYSSPAISGGVLFVGNENGNMYAIGKGCRP